MLGSQLLQLKLIITFIKNKTKNLKLAVCFDLTHFFMFKNITNNCIYFKQNIAHLRSLAQTF